MEYGKIVSSFFTLEILPVPSRDGVNQGSFFILSAVELSGHFSVWICSPEGEFLKGRFVWAEWDVNEMKAREKEIVEDPMLLTLGLGGWPFSSR